ncbi:MAG: LPXTG cell wall anchor domain-containing protein [Chloroflexia bacterium]
MCAVNFIPESGGPGTLVRIEVSQCYSGAPFFLQPGLSIPYSGNDVGPPTFQPIGKPLAGVNLPGDAYFSTMVTIPSHLPDGSHIANRGLTLRVTNKYGYDIAEGGASVFTITSSLPQAGAMVDHGWLPILMAVALLLTGGFLRRKMAG